MKQEPEETEKHKKVKSQIWCHVHTRKNAYFAIGGQRIKKLRRTVRIIIALERQNKDQGQPT